ncbi:hypothetical protein B0H11DRAFT_1937388 [Mycena galericulata]|nr:hypothetical protein B0H11DRAFT_1937388 [Mycena galericulata]
MTMEHAFIISRLLPSMSKLLAEPEKIGATRLSWIHTDDKDLYTSLQAGKSMAMPDSVMTDFITSAATLQLVEGLLGKASVSPLKELFPSLNDLRGSSDVIERARIAWMTRSDDEVAALILDAWTKLSAFGGYKGTTDPNTERTEQGTGHGCGCGERTEQRTERRTTTYQRTRTDLSGYSEKQKKDHRREKARLRKQRQRDRERQGRGP